MRYFTPLLSLVEPTSTQSQFQEKLGGLPWGLPTDKWPHCAECGAPLTHLFSLEHHPERLNLGREGRVVLVFQCNDDPGMCETWSASSGANAVLFLDRDEQVTSLTICPKVDVEVENEVRIDAWQEAEDEVDPLNFAAYFDDSQQWALHREVWETEEGEYWQPMFEGTKLGSVPHWIQSASEGPKAPFQFVGQFQSWHQVAEESVTTANYGDMGTAYLFIHADPEAPHGEFFWQCG